MLTSMHTPMRCHWKPVSEPKFRTCINEQVNHNVEILGWGETKSGVKYWIGRNSWGTYWGEGGFFRIGRGGGRDKNLRIEADCQWMVPSWEDLDSMLDGKPTPGFRLVVSMNGTRKLQPTEWRIDVSLMLRKNAIPTSA